MKTTQSQSRTVLRLPLSVYPGLHHLATDLVAGAPGAVELLPPFRPAEIASLHVARDPQLLDELASSNRGWGNEIGAELDRFARGGAAVIGGQQVGFAGGPLLTIDKVASILRIRDELQSRGVPAVGFFWMATEDHDFQEVSTLLLQTPAGAKRVTTAARPVSPRSVGDLPIPDSLRSSFLVAAGLPAEPEWLTPGITFRDSFARLIATAFGSGRVVLVDSMLPRMRALGAPLLCDVLGSLDDVERIVETRSNELGGRLYPPQIQPSTDGHYALFFWRNAAGERLPIRQSDGGFLVGEERVGQAELMGRIEATPESLSTGALTRPLLQDFIFRPAVFVGGPSEVAYYAQASAIHRTYGVPVPQIALRGHLLVAPTKVLRTVGRYSIAAEEIFRHPGEILSAREAPRIEDLERDVEQAAGVIGRELAHIRGLIADADATQVRPADRAIRHVRREMERLGNRGRRAIIRRDSERHRAIERLCSTLAPGGTPQDRVAGWITWWMMYRDQLIEEIVEQVEPASEYFKVVGL
jgi:bacillithiol synthase